MGYYDDVRYINEARKAGFTNEELLSLEKEVKERKEIMVYDDYEGMKKVLMARKSNILSVYGGGSSSHNIYYDPNKMQQIAKKMLEK